MNNENTAHKNNKYDDYISFRYKKNTKDNLKKLIEDRVDNDNKLKLEMVNTCSEYCFANLKFEHLSANENICLINCFKKYLDTLEIAEKLYDNLKDNKIRKSLIIKGDFQRIAYDFYKLYKV